jgi:hypothetical protein
MESKNRIRRERQVTSSCQLCKQLSLKSEWPRVLRERLLVDSDLTPLLPWPFVNLIVIILINRKHYLVCGSWGHRQQFSFACCAPRYKWSNKLSLSAKNFHNWFQSQGTFLFVFKHPAILIYVNVKISTFFFLCFIQCTEYYLAQGNLQNSWIFPLI